MIEEPPLLRILGRGSRVRPTLAQIEAFRGVPTGHLCDAMNGLGAMGHHIKPLPGVPRKLCGPALTADCGPADILALLGALTEIDPGDVVMQSTGGWMGCASAGDLVSGMIKNCGGAGLVTDGCVRDVAGIQEVGMPVFCAGVTPNSPYGKGPGAVGYPVEMAGRHVVSGDMIVGDADGVVVVPFGDIHRVLATLEGVRSAEASLEAEVKGGLKFADAVRDLVEGDQTDRA